MRRRPPRLDGFRGIELERPEGEIVEVASEIGHGAVAEIPPAIPLRPREIDGVKRPVRRRADPQIPVEVRRRGLGFRRRFERPDDVPVALGRLLALPAPSAANPDVCLANRANGAGLDFLDHAPVIVAGVDLGAHLRGDARRLGRLREHPRLVHVARQRFLAKDVLLGLQRWQHGEGVRVLCRAHHHGIDVPGLLVQLAEVAVRSRLGMLGCRAIQVMCVDVAERHDVLGPCCVGHVASAAAPAPDDGEIQFRIG